MQTEVAEILKESFEQLPKAVQEAITSANIEEKLRLLAKKHSLHLDQWVHLENEVMMVLLGIQPIDQLGKNIARETGIPNDQGALIARDASETIFEPIRRELERELAHPDAKPEDMTPEEQRRQEMLAEARDAEVAADSDTSNAPSAEEPPKMQGDPYREPIA